MVECVLVEDDATFNFLLIVSSTAVCNCEVKCLDISANIPITSSGVTEGEELICVTLLLTSGTSEWEERLA